LIELFNRRAGVTLVHVPYKGAAPAMVDLRGGRIDATFATPLDAIPVARDGAGRLLGVTSQQPLDLLPEVAPIARTYPGFEGVFWQGLFAPRGTPTEVVARLTTALRAATDDEALRKSTAERGVTLRSGDAQVLRDRLARDTVLWSRIIREAGIKPE
jgi:tripartite-type tricarboxylate transporter receptor subunit TctC